jgi:hypothetical protein
MRLVIVLLAFLTLSGAVSESAYAAHRPRHQHGKNSHYKPDKNAYLFGKHKAPKKLKLSKHHGYK